MKGLRPLKHPQSAFGLRPHPIFRPPPNVRLTYTPDYQPYIQISLVQMYQGNMRKAL